MEENKIVDEFWEGRAKIEDARLATQFREDDSLSYDVALVKQYLPNNARILDLGCGTCTLTNELIPYASYIRGVDKRPGLLKFSKGGKNFETIVGDISEYRDDKKYDVILIIGVLQYIKSDKIIENIYNNCKHMLADNGYLIVKQQSGVEEDVEVNQYSEHLKVKYYSLYRHKNKDEALLRNQGFDVEIINIYPSNMNHWSNTHHYAYIAKI